MTRFVPLLLLAALVPAGAEIENEIPLGIEAVTGFRSDYVWRGFKVGDSVADFQLQAQFALSDHWSLDFGGSYATETGDGDFSEATVFADLTYETKEWSAGISVTGHEFDHRVLKSGVDFAPSFTWHASTDLDFTAGIAYDTGAGGTYGWLESKWSKALSDSAYVSVLGGTSFTGDYYGRDGWNDLYARASLTYALNKRVSLTPFIGVSVPMNSDAETNRLFGGLWFEVNF